MRAPPTWVSVSEAVVLVVALGIPAYALLLMAATSSTFGLIAGLAASGVYIVAAAWYALSLGMMQLWITDSGVQFRFPFALRRNPHFLVPLERTSTIYMTGRRVWWGPPKKRFTSLFLWTSPESFRRAVGQHPQYSVKSL